MKAALLYKFDHDDSESLVAEIKCLADAMNIVTVDGKNLYAGEIIGDQIKELIRESDFIIAIIFKDTDHNYISNEIGVASGLGIPVILITDDKDAGGVVSHKYKIDLSKRSNIAFTAAVVRTMNRIVNNRGIKQGVTNKDVQHDNNEILSDMFKNDFFNTERSRKNYHYDIVLEEHSESSLKNEYFKAFFTIGFESILQDDEVVVEFARSVDNFHKLYSKLVKNKKSIYRYILKTTKDIKLTGDLFNIIDISVNKDIKLDVNISSEKPKNDKITFLCTSARGELTQLVGKKVSFDLSIETIVEKNRNEFTVIFGYPVKNIHTSLVFGETDIANIDVIDFVSSTNLMEKSPFQGVKRYGAQARLNGWAMPNSGIVYVWQR